MQRGVTLRVLLLFSRIEVCRNALLFGAGSVLIVSEPDPLGRQTCGGAMAQLRQEQCLFNFVGGLFGELADGDRPGHVRLPGAADRFYTLIHQAAAWSLRRKLPGRAPVARFTCRLR